MHSWESLLVNTVPPPWQVQQDFSDDVTLSVHNVVLLLSQYQTTITGLYYNTYTNTGKKKDHYPHYTILTNRMHILKRKVVWQHLTAANPSFKSLLKSHWMWTYPFFSKSKAVHILGSKSWTLQPWNQNSSGSPSVCRAGWASIQYPTTSCVSTHMLK